MKTAWHIKAIHINSDESKVSIGTTVVAKNIIEAINKAQDIFGKAKIVRCESEERAL